MYRTIDSTPLDGVRYAYGYALPAARDVQVETTPGAAARAGHVAPNAGQSWVDALHGALEHLPWPAWASYVGAWLVLVGIELWIKWSEGAYAVGTVFPFHPMALGTGVYLLALIHYLDRSMAASLAQFRPSLRVGDREFERLRRSITTMPARATWVATFAGLAFGIANRVLFVAPKADVYRYSTTGFGAVFEFSVLACLTWSIVFVFLFHGIRQLRMVAELYGSSWTIELFDRGPAYAFSRFAAHTGIGTLLVGYAWLAMYPRDADGSAFGLVVATVGLAILVALASFLLPLWGAHQRLRLEKEARMRSAHQTWEAAVERVASSVQAGDFAAAQAAATAVTAAEQTLDRIGRISTWPWQPATLRGFLTAVFLPLFIWAIQQVMASRLGW